MLSDTFARRLLGWSTPALLAGLGLILGGIFLAYAGARSVPLPLQVVGHWFIGLGAFGLKTFYIARLAALDVLAPHPEGWLSESAQKAR